MAGLRCLRIHEREMAWETQSSDGVLSLTGWRVGARLGLVDSEDTLGQQKLYLLLQRMNVNFDTRKIVSVPVSLLRRKGITVPGDAHWILRFKLDAYVTTLKNSQMPATPTKFWALEVQGDSHSSNSRIEKDELRTLALAALGIKTIPIPDRELFSAHGRETWRIRLAEEFGLEGPP